MGEATRAREAGTDRETERDIQTQGGGDRLRQPLRGRETEQTETERT